MCVCVPFPDLCLFKIGIGMRSSLIIVCINSVFPRLQYFVPYFSIFSWPGANWFFFFMFLFHFVCRNKESKTF